MTLYSLKFAQAETPIGLINLFASEKGLVAALFDDSFLSRDLIIKLKKQAQFQTNNLLKQAKNALTLYFNASFNEINKVPLELQGTNFQLKVWSELQKLEAGKVVSYNKLAEQLDNAKASRAIGSACAKNSVLIFIPCHRVIRQNEELGEYRGGIERKRYLLELEGYKFVPAQNHQTMRNAG